MNPLSIESKKDEWDYLRTKMADHDLKEVAICAHFGCSKKLTLIENLAGNCCNYHANGKKTDIMNVLKFK